MPEESGSVTQVFTHSGAEFGAETDRVKFGQYGINIKLDDGNTFVPYTSVDFAITVDNIEVLEDAQETVRQENSGDQAA